MRGVDEHRRAGRARRAGVVAVRRVGLGVQAAGEHDARHLLLEEQVDVVRLGHAADGLRAQDRREALLGEGAADHLGEGREDRVLELRQDEADEARALAAQLGRSLVAQDVERGQDRLAGRLGDAGLLVEDAADRRLAHPDLAGDVGQSVCHARHGTQIRASRCKSLAGGPAQGRASR